MIRKRNVIKRICALVLSAVMFTSLLPVDVLAAEVQLREAAETIEEVVNPKATPIDDAENEEIGTEDSKTTDVANDEIEEITYEVANDSYMDQSRDFNFEETIETVNKYKVEIGVKNISSFTYAVVTSVDNAPKVSFTNVPVNANQVKYVLSDVAENSYILIGKVVAKDGCTNSRMTIGSSEAQKVTVTEGAEAVEVWSSEKITENIIIEETDSSKLIYAEADGETYYVYVDVENVNEIKYRIYTVNDSYIFAEEEKSAEISNGYAEIPVEKGYKLALTEITPADDYSAPVVKLNGSVIEKGKIGNIDESNELNGWNIDLVDGNKYVTATCAPAVEYTVEMNLTNVSKVKCVVYTEKAGEANKVNFVKDATITDNVATIKVPNNCTLAVSDITYTYDNIAVKKGTETLPENLIDENIGSAYKIGKIVANILKDDSSNKIVIESKAPETVKEIKIPVENIKSLQFVVYTDKDNITSQCLKDADLSETGFAKVSVPVGSLVAIRSDKIAKMDDDDYLNPYVEKNGIKVDNVEVIGKYKNASSSSDLKGYVLGKVSDDTSVTAINSGYKVIAEHASYDVNITAICAKAIKYKIYAKADYSDNPVEQTAIVKSIGTDKKGVTIEVPTGKYLVITEVEPMDGCYGTESVVMGSKLTKDTIGFKLGKITKDIKEGITAQIEENAYDVTIKFPDNTAYGATKPVSVKYVITGDINNVNTTTETKNLTDGAVTIKVEKNKYLVITEFVLAEGRTARTKVDFVKYGTDKYNRVVGDKENIVYGQVGKYASGAFLSGWNIGKVTNTMPLAEQDAKSYILEAKCYNYCMYIEPQKTGNVTITYKSGTTSEMVSSVTRYSVKVKDTADGIEAEDLVLNILEDNKAFVSNDILAYAVNEYTNAKSEPVECTVGSGGDYTLSKGKIAEWSTNDNLYTKIVIECKSKETIIFPSVTDGAINVYKYVEGMPLSYYTGTPINVDEKPYTDVIYNSDFQFVVIPVDVNFDVKSITKEYGSATLNPGETKTLNDDNQITLYTLKGVKSEVKLNSLLKTKSTAEVTYTVNNQTGGAATFNSTNSNTVSEDSTKYKVQTGVDYVLFTVTLEKSSLPIVKLGDEEDGYEEIESYNLSDVTGGKRIYSYKVLSKDIKDKTVEITKENNVRDFYLQAKENEIKEIIVSYNGSSYQEVEGDRKPSTYNPGYIIHHYVVPFGKTISVQAIAWDNCQLTTATINYGTADAQKDKTVSYGAGGVIKYEVKDSNNKLGRDFVLGSKSLTTLYVAEEYAEAYIDKSVDPYVFVPSNLIPTTKNSYTVEVSKNLKTFRAAILVGREALALDDPSVKYVAKVGSTVVTNDIITGISDFKELDFEVDPVALRNPAKKALLVFDFEKASIAGKTVDVSIYKNNTVVGKIKFKVSPSLNTVTLSDNKSNAISQEYLSAKTYKLAYNSGVKAQDVAIKYEYFDISENEWKKFQTTKYEKNTDDVWVANTTIETGMPEGIENLVVYNPDAKSIKLTANQATLEELAFNAGYKAANTTTLGLPKLRLSFYDVTDKDFDSTLDTYNGCVLKQQKEITFTMNTLRGITPTAKFISASDTYMNIGLTAPKQYASYKNSLYYIVKAEAVDRYTKFANDDASKVLVPEKTVIVPMTDVAAKIDLAKPDVNPGDGAAWKYNVTVMIAAYNGDFVTAYKDNPTIDGTGWYYFEHSKSKSISKVSTKAPYYETKIKATAKSNKIYQGQKNVQVAQATFNAKTTYYDLELRMYSKGTSLEKALDENLDPVAYDSSVSGTDAKLSQDPNNPARILLDTTGIKPGNYVLYITPEADGRALSREAYASSASIAITIYESIKGLTADGDVASFNVKVPSTSLYRKENATATMTASAVFSNKPKSTKVTWKIKGVDGATNDITKYVSINSKGKITVSKSFKYESDITKSANNKFKVIATAADYTSDPERIAESAVITIRPYSSAVTGLQIRKNGTAANPDTDGKYTADMLDELYAFGVDINNCTVKSSNTKVIAIGDIKDSNTRLLTVKGAGKARITVTCNDGAKSSKYIDVVVKNKSYQPGLGLLVGGEDGTLASKRGPLTVTNGEMNISLGVKALKGEVGEYENIETLTSYSLKVLSGGKLYSNGNHNYTLVPTSATTTIVLTDNTKSKSNSMYSQKITINNSLYSIKKLKASLTKTSFKPGEGGSVLKITGFSKGTNLSSLNYQVALVADYADYHKSEANKARYDAFISGAQVENKMFNQPIEPEPSSQGKIVDLSYDEVYKNALVPNDNGIIKINMAKGEDYGKAIGKYKFNAYIFDDDSDKIVAIIVLPTIQLKAADKPKIDLIAGYTVKKTENSEATITLDATKTKMSTVNSWKVVDIKDANISGAINNKFSKYYDIKTEDAEHGKITVTAKSTVSALDYNQNVYADVTYKYEDLAGKVYYVTKRIYFKSTEY